MNILICFVILCERIKAKGVAFNVSLYDEKPSLFLNFYNEQNVKIMKCNTYLPATLTFSVSNQIQSNIKENVTLSFTENYSTYRYISNVLIDGVHINNFSCYFSYIGAIFSSEFGLAFGYHIINKETSIIHLLYNQGYANHIMFAFHNIREDFGSHLYIGEIPNNEHKKLPYKAIIKINEELPTWGFTLNKVKFDNETFELNASAIIANGIDGVFIYNKLYKMLEKKILTYNECEINGNAFYKGEENDILCPMNGEVLHKEISFIFEEVEIKIEMIKLFKIYGNHTMKSYFRSDDYSEHYYNFTGVFLGNFFINQFNYTIFDYEAKTVSFYSDSIHIKDNNDNFNITIVIAIVISVICLLNFVYLFFYKYL